MNNSNILVLNSGSSSIKFHLYHHNVDDSIPLLLDGSITKIGEEVSSIKLNHNDDSPVIEYDEVIENHSHALHKILEVLQSEGGCSASDLMFVGHRVVHGGTVFEGDTAYVVNDDVIQQIESLFELAPLHNPINLLGIKESIHIFTNIPQIAVFDSSFHHTIPEVAHRYALSTKLVDPSVRKYGFHGISYEYITSEATSFLENIDGRRSEDLKLIALHLGNGCSACAIKGGNSIDTSMGLTPLQGLMMGTRSGDVDPAVPFHLLKKRSKTGPLTEKDVVAVEKIFNQESGLKGVCGQNDMRKVIAAMKSGDKNAELAFEMFCYRIKQYIGSYFVTLGGCDAIVFTAGIGENSSDVRRVVCEGLACLGVELDEHRNGLRSNSARLVSTDSSKVRVLVIPTDEEKQIAILGSKIIKT